MQQNIIETLEKINSKLVFTASPIPTTSTSPSFYYNNFYFLHCYFCV